MCERTIAATVEKRIDDIHPLGAGHRLLRLLVGRVRRSVSPRALTDEGASESVRNRTAASSSASG